MSKHVILLSPQPGREIILAESYVCMDIREDVYMYTMCVRNCVHVYMHGRMYICVPV